ncbi:hypothetical protein GALMADRAFT_145755 [Galerina marginata CBS 339.88]|uniref:MARVEL domain-containing protein n=1 Tax=Galerina marginata (strain CBS 339.88) TaxID=685588 RepID=A0A067SDQ2_GALM3|nr:hypothetical protein GALMADRAFT_145755 [Galerina marginata CBS 339.88]
MAESIARLDDAARINDQFDEQAHLPARRTSTFKKLIIISLVLSTLTVAILIANYIIINHAPFIRTRWGTQQSSRALAIIAFVVVIVSAFNVLVKIPNLLNVIFDIVLAVCLIEWTFGLIASFPSGDWCTPWGSGPNQQPDPKCEDWKLTVIILTGIAAGLGGILGIIQISLLVLRSAAIFRTKFWKIPAAWSIPTGQVSFQISLKVVGEEGGTTEGREGQGTDARSGSGHGPIYL